MQLEKPVVWTLHDQWAFTGGCHYSSGCHNFIESCQNCPQLNKTSHDIPHIAHKQKIEHINNKKITFVSPSRWLAECARKANVTKNMRVEVIPNSVEIDIFTPFPKKEAKINLNIKPNIVTLLFGSISSKEKRKGYKELIKVIQYCSRNQYVKNLIGTNKISLLTFGEIDEEIKKVGIPIVSFGFIQSDDKLAQVYSAADAFLLPSLEDNFPNTILEAMSCGTPCITFSVGGLPELIQNGFNGYMVPCFDINIFGEKVINIVKNPAKRKQMGTNCRELIEKKYQLKHQAIKYIELYEDLIRQNKLRRKNGRKKNNGNNQKNNFLVEYNSTSIGNFKNVFNSFYANLVKRNDNKMNKMQRKIDFIESSYIYRIGSFFVSAIKKIKSM
jgi:glycosyltransferase involved in cell wall biosynthesis